MTIETFRAWKIDRIRTHLKSARYQRLRGRHTQAVWYQYLASIARATLTDDTEYLTVMRNRMVRNRA